MTPILFTGSLLLLGIAAALALARALRPGDADRVLGLDTLLAVVVMAVIVDAARRGDDTYLDVAVVAALLGFVGTVMLAWYLGRKEIDHG